MTRRVSHSAAVIISHRRPKFPPSFPLVDGEHMFLEQHA
ncbi:hypothetical protein GFS60_08036 (plasmid) [Rhodococcus sp. WAY2]|nr:hypothetical protein GFS60_08036 [Rhodococcus sp. WAY2]